MNKPCHITIYTHDSALEFDIKTTCDNFQDTLADALENGTVILDTVEGSRLILSAINVVAIEIQSLESDNISPPL